MKYLLKKCGVILSEEKQKTLEKNMEDVRKIRFALKVLFETKLFKKDLYYYAPVFLETEEKRLSEIESNIRILISNIEVEILETIEKIE